MHDTRGNHILRVASPASTPVPEQWFRLPHIERRPLPDIDCIVSAFDHRVRRVRGVVESRSLQK